MEIQPVINKFEKVRMFIQNHKSELIQVTPHPTYDVKVRGGISSPNLIDYSFLYPRSKKWHKTSHG